MPANSTGLLAAYGNIKYFVPHQQYVVTMLLVLFTSFISTSELFAKKAQKFQPEIIYNGKDVVWSFDFISDSELVVTQRSGRLHYYNVSSKKVKNLTTPKIEVEGQGGLLDVHFRTIQKKPYVYVTFSEKVKDTVTTSLARGEWQHNKVLGWSTLFRANIKSDTGRHFGSRLAFVEDHLFMTVGDRGERDYAQELSLHNGKILRLTLDGKPAKGNPFDGKKGALAEIWSYGHRNPQGIAYDQASKKLYSCEFGPRGGDELNLIEKGKNYGWPIITYGKEYWGPSIGTTEKKGMEQPLAYWVPSISPSGMEIYTGDRHKQWKGHIFLANLSSRHLRRLKLDDNKVVEQEELFKELEERVRHVRNGPDGYIYFSTDSGKIYRF